MTTQEGDTSEPAASVQKVVKATYETPELIVHGKVEKITLQTGDPIIGGGGTGPGGSTLF